VRDGFSNPSLRDLRRLPVPPDHARRLDARLHSPAAAHPRLEKMLLCASLNSFSSGLLWIAVR